MGIAVSWWKFASMSSRMRIAMTFAMGIVTRAIGHADFICARHFRIRVFYTSEIGHAR